MDGLQKNIPLGSATVRTECAAPILGARNKHARTVTCVVKISLPNHTTVQRFLHTSFLQVLFRRCSEEMKIRDFFSHRPPAVSH